MNKKKVTLLLALLAVAAYGEESIDLGKSVIYSTTGFATEMREVAANPTIVTSDKIKEKEYKTVLDVLKDIPSVSITKDTFGSTVDLRGQGSAIAKRNVQILIDGVAVNSLDTSMTSTPINTIPVSSIERIEVIPGGGSVLYGSGTAGGVINIITKNGKGLRADVAYDHTSFGGNKYDVSAGQSLGNFDANVIYSKTNADGYRSQSHDDTEFFQGNLKYNISDTQALEFKYSHHESDIFSPGMLTRKQLQEDRKQAGDKVTKVNTEKDDYVLTYNTKLSDNLEFNMVAFQNETNLKISDKGKKPYGFFDDKKKGIKPKLKYSYGKNEFANSSVIVGFDYIDNDAQRLANMEMGAHAPVVTTTNDFNKTTYAGFIMNNLKYNDFEFNQGFRFEKAEYDIFRSSSTSIGGKTMGKPKIVNTSKSEENFALELSGSYLYSDTGKVYTRLEQGFTSPPPALLTDAVPYEKSVMGRPMSGTKYELNDLESETYRSIEFGMSDYIGNTSINTSIFYTQTDNEIYTYMKGMATGMSQKILNYNIDKTERFGAEIALEHYFGKLTLSESYQYMHAEIKKGTEKQYDDKGNRVNGADLAGRKIEGVPTHKFTFGAKYDFTPNFNINGEVIYTGDSYIKNDNLSGKRGSYTITNIRTGYSFDNGLTLYAGINNLFDKKYYDSVDYSEKDGYTYDPAAERNYYVGFRYSL
ncbi:TonB-dependent receptor [Fusobacterium sp.]|uniref:TonB-dependent receptor n=1 Tax=Fusobacterium sp. TaxID=68766 RepID=UPI0025C2F1B0|nr:TonB-dependent receptor [Fusobacterium sp.]